LVSHYEQNIVLPAMQDAILFMKKENPPKLPYVLTPEDLLLRK